MLASTRISLFCLSMAAPLAGLGLWACQKPDTCGNGVIDRGSKEECDDGNFVENDGCTFNCTLDTKIAGALCFPPINPPAPKAAGGVNCRPTFEQKCVPCASIPGGGITGENASWNSCHPIPGPFGGMPNCVPSPMVPRCIPCDGNQQLPGMPEPRGLKSGADIGDMTFCGDGQVTPPEVCDPEESGELDEDCLSIECGIDGNELYGAY